MGSLQVVKAFLWHAWFFGITYEWIPCNTVMSFANSHTERLKWAVRVKWPTTPALYTTIDVHESGTVPILLSLPQMMNLRFGLTLSDVGCDLTCKLLGYDNERLPMSTSGHLVLDLCRFRREKIQNSALRHLAITDYGDHSFMASKSTPGSKPSIDDDERTTLPPSDDGDDDVDDDDESEAPEDEPLPLIGSDSGEDLSLIHI